jgi:AraC-like DNA-binding protein
MTMAQPPLALLPWPLRAGTIGPGEADSLTTVSFSTEDLAEPDRVAMWCDHYARIAMKVEIEPSADGPFHACVLSRILPGLHLMSGSLSAARVSRSRDGIADGNDDLALIINRSGNATVSARGRELPLAQGDAVLTSSGEMTVFDRWSPGESISLRVPRPVLASLIGDLDDAVMRPVQGQSEILKLLTGYAHSLIEENGLAAPGLRYVAVSHIHDLVALALGPRQCAMRAVGREGLRAARLRAAKAHVVRNSTRHDVSVGAVAVHLGVTTRYLQRLFEADGLTFSAFLLNQRLTNAYRMLCDVRYADQPVSTIAYDVGFSDLSYFNRSFRYRYNATPTDVRERRIEP